MTPPDALAAFERLLDEFSFAEYAAIDIIPESIELRDAARAALLEHVRGMAEDAARYRWLRGNAGEIYTSSFSWRTKTSFVDDPGDAASLDAAIDAARKEQTP